MLKPTAKSSAMGISVLANKSTQVEEDILRPATQSLFHSLEDSSQIENQTG
jgi:hypothetical protein